MAWIELKDENQNPIGWFETLDKAKALGLEYANNGIAAGELSPSESPLSGEWAGSIAPRDVVNMATGIDGAFAKASSFEVTDLCDAWEDGYFSADWPERFIEED